MKRLLRLMLAVLLSCSVFAIAEAPAEVQAKEEYNIYPMACSAYEVDVLTVNGTFEKKGCYNDFNAAKNDMYGYGDGAVVRHMGSYSVTKIVAMTNGVVYSYPQRSNANTAVITQFMENIPNKKSTYVTVHREMAYKGTYSYNGNGDGWIRVKLNGFDGYISLKNVDLVPMKAVSEDIPMTLGGNSTYMGGEDPFKVHVRQAYYRVERGGNYKDLVYHCFSGWPSNGEYPAEWTFRVGPAADWMNYGDIYYSDDGYTFCTDRYYSQVAGTYYGYYQFMPLRTRSAIPAEVYDKYLQTKNIDGSSVLWGKGPVFVQAQEEFGMNALAVYAMACLESAYGTSQYAVQRNNLFGWSAYDSDPNQASWFKSADQAIREHMGINLRGFVDINDYRFFGGHLGNKGSGINVKYAGDPYWGMKIAALAYEIDKCANDYNGSLTDFNRASLGIVANDSRVDVRKAINGNALYNTAYGATYQKNHTVTILSESSGWYEIQSTNILEGGSVRSLQDTGLLNYDWNTNVGWLPKDEVTRINSTITLLANKGDTPTGDFTGTLTSAQLDGSTLHLAGEAYRPGIYVTDENKAEHELNVLDEVFNEAQSLKPALTVTNNDRIAWKGDLDLSGLKEGIYIFRLDAHYSLYSAYDDTYRLVLGKDTEQKADQGGRTYQLKDEGGLLTLRISPISCGTGASYDGQTDACVCDTGYENWTAGKGCTLKPPADNSKLMQGVEKTAYDEETATVTVEGMAFLTGMNAGADADIEHQLILVDMDTREETVLETETLLYEPALNFGDGYDYSRIRYRALIPLAGTDGHEYYLKIRVRNGEAVREKMLITNDAALDIEDMHQGDWTVRLFANPAANFRMELISRITGVDRSLIKKPTRRPSVYGETVIAIKDEKLTIDGLGFITNTYINEENKPDYAILLEDEAGSITRVEAVNKACSVDLAALRKTKYTIHQACFDFTAELSELAPGSYRMYLDIGTDAARDIFELYNYQESELPEETAGTRTYRIVKTKGHSQYILEITDSSVQAAPLQALSMGAPDSAEADLPAEEQQVSEEAQPEVPAETTETEEPNENEEG